MGREETMLMIANTLRKVSRIKDLPYLEWDRERHDIRPAEQALYDAIAEVAKDEIRKREDELNPGEH